MLVASPRGHRARRFRDLPDLLEPGDLLVVNTSATLPAALPPSARRRALRAAPLDAAARRVARRRPRALGRRAARRRRRRAAAVAPASGCALPGGGAGRAARAVPRRAAAVGRTAARCPSRCSPTSTGTARRSATATCASRARWPTTRRLRDRAGQRRDAERRPAVQPRACSTRSATRGVGVAPIVLHTGVSSLERGEPPYPERFKRARPPTAAARQRRGGA